MSDEELIKALYFCQFHVFCGKCPINNEDKPFCCKDSIKGLAADKIQRLQRENEQLKELLRLAVEDMSGICVFCKKRNDCKSRKGSHKYCWQWQNADKLKGLGIEI